MYTDSIREKALRELVQKSLGSKKAQEYFNFKIKSFEEIVQSARTIMSYVPPTFGSCVLISSAWAGFLSDHCAIPAVVVAGDLTIDGKFVFKYEEALPKPTKTNSVIIKSWSGHCWIEIDGVIGDLSIFRTAYAITGPSRLKNFILNTFGQGRGALITGLRDLPPAMIYTPKEVLNDDQVDMFIGSLSYQLEQQS